MNVKRISGVKRMKNADNGWYCEVLHLYTTHNVYRAENELTFFFGGRSICSPASPRSFNFRASFLRLTNIIGLEQSAGGGILPSPTSDLNVSGMKLDLSEASSQIRKRGWTYKMMGTRTTPHEIVKNQKIALHPRVCANIPPIPHQLSPSISKRTSQRTEQWSESGTHKRSKLENSIKLAPFPRFSDIGNTSSPNRDHSRSSSRLYPHKLCPRKSFSIPSKPPEPLTCRARRTSNNQ